MAIKLVKKENKRNYILNLKREKERNLKLLKLY